MKKRMFTLFLMILTAGVIFLSCGYYHYYQKKSQSLPENAIAKIQPQVAPQTMSHFLRGYF